MFRDDSLTPSTWLIRRPPGRNKSVSNSSGVHKRKRFSPPLEPMNEKIIFSLANFHPTGKTRFNVVHHSPPFVVVSYLNRKINVDG
jgi:hypothetical protein